MELNLDQGQATYRIESYSPGKIKISGQEYQDSLIIMPESLIIPWRPKTIDALLKNDFEDLLKILQGNTQVLLLGTGPTQKFLDPKLFQNLIHHHIGVEVMNTFAACRTYTVLVSEHRNPAAALLL